MIELVVALGILSMLTLLATEALRMAGQAWGRNEAALDHLEDTLVGQEVLRHRLSGLQAPYPGRPGMLPDRSFVGSEQSMSFTADAPGSVDGALWARYRVFVEPASPAAKLVIAWTPIDSGLTESKTPAETRTETLLDHAAGIDFSYFADNSSISPSEPGPQGWQPVWSHRDHAPVLIRIAVRFADQDPRRWPALVVKPRLTAPPDCRFDMVSQQCR